MDVDPSDFYDEDDHDMPSLQSVSNSSESDVSDSEDEARRQVIDAVEDDDGDSTWSDIEDEEQMPPLEPTSGSRRPRGTDDNDEERDRRPPSQRVTTPNPPTTHTNPIPPPPPPNPQPPLAQFFNILQNMAAHAPPPPPKDSPENALRIINGLETVPDGVIRRLERVSAMSTPVVDDVGAVGGDSGCAICWDRLLDGDGAEFASSDPSHSNPSEPTTTTTKPPEGIIALPCAHLYHASCLIPWFSRPGQTTCPTCRFDLDPKGIIWYGGRKGEPHTRGPMPFFGFGAGPDGAVFDDLGPIPEEDVDGELGDFEWQGGPLWDFGVPPEEDANDEGQDDDMPPLEPIPGRPTTQPADDDMPPLEPVAGRATSNANNALPTANPPASTTPSPPITSNNPPAAPTNTTPLIFGVDVVFGTMPFNPAPAPAQRNQPPTAQPPPQRAAPMNPTPTPNPNPQNPFDQFRNAFRGMFSNNANVGINTGGANNGAPPQLAQMFSNFVPMGRPPANGTTAPAPQAPPMFMFGAPGGTGGATPAAAQGRQPAAAPPPQANPFTFHGPGAANGPTMGGTFPMQPEQATAFLRAIGLGDILNMNGGGGNNGNGPPLFPDDFHVHVGMGMPDWMRRGTGTAQGPPAFAFPLHFGPGAANPNPPSTHDDEPPQEWTPPDPPGVTLRERVERRERDAGLRCSDSSCGIGPSDDDPFIEVPENAQRRIPITGPDGKTACSHTFHPTCLVSAQRSRRGWLEPQLAEGKEDAIEVSCSLCRADGTVPPAEWLEGSILPLD